eukprot:4322089-Prymnesium_polylepis.1
MDPGSCMRRYISVLRLTQPQSTIFYGLNWGLNPSAAPLSSSKKLSRGTICATPGTRTPVPAGTARTNMSAMALLRTQPTAAIPFGSLHIVSACPQHNISTSTSAYPRRAALALATEPNRSRT